MNVEPWTAWAIAITVGLSVRALLPTTLTGPDAWTPTAPEPEAGR